MSLVPSPRRKPERESHGYARLHHAPAHRSWRPLRPQDRSLEPSHERVHLRRAGRHSHHRPDADGAAAPSGAAIRARHRGGRRPGSVRRHQAAGAQANRRDRRNGRPVLHEQPLARRHPDQLEDGVAVDQAPGPNRQDAREGRRGHDQEGAPRPRARAGEPSGKPRRHSPAHRRSGHSVCHRRQEGGAGGCRGEEAQDSDRRNRRHQLRARRHRLRDPRKRRRRPRHRALLQADAGGDA